jgi:hypothetical protein
LRLRRLTIALLPLASAVAGLGVSQAASAQVVDHYCQRPTGDYCTAVLKQHGRIKLSLSAFSFRGRYQVCVDGPRSSGKVCHRGRLSRHHGVYADKIDWAKHFPHRAKGRYKVSWRKAGGQLGRQLSFHWGGFG